MSIDRDIFAQWKLECECGEQLQHFCWISSLPLCPVCQKAMRVKTQGQKFGEAPSVHGDECDVVIRHGLCNEDGSPRRWRSKSELKKAAFNSGYTQGDDTPKPNQRILERRAIEAEIRSKS